MQKLPPGVKNGGALRAEAWKAAVHQGHVLMKRNPPEAWKYEQAARAIAEAGGSSLERLAVTAYGSKEQKAALA